MKYPTALILIFVVTLLASYSLAAPVYLESSPSRQSKRFHHSIGPRATLCRALCRTVAKELKANAVSFAIDAGKQYLDYAGQKKQGAIPQTQAQSGAFPGTVVTQSRPVSVISGAESQGSPILNGVQDANRRKHLDISQRVMAENREKQASLVNKVNALRLAEPEKEVLTVVNSNSTSGSSTSSRKSDNGDNISYNINGTPEKGPEGRIKGSRTTIITP